MTFEFNKNNIEIMIDKFAENYIGLYNLYLTFSQFGAT